MDQNRNRSGIVSDIALLAFLLLIFICIAFTAGNPNAYIQNLIILNASFLFIVITYFSTVTSGLVLNIMFIFGYGSFVLYQTVTRGEAIGLGTYFWLIMTPLLTVAVWLYTSSNRQLQVENEELRRQRARVATLDENTDLKNSLAFQKDASVFIGLSIRYNIPLTLVVIRVKYWNEIRKLIRDDRLMDAISDISKICEASIRTNDILYLLEQENATWGLMLFTDKEGSKIVRERIKQKLADLNTKDFADKYKVNLDLKIGAVEYTQEQIQSPFDFIDQAKKQLEYDV